MTIEYVAIERPMRGLATRQIADRYREFAMVYINGEWRVTLYPQMDGYVQATFFTVIADFSDPDNPVGTKAISLNIRPESVDETLSGLAELLPPF